MVSEDSIIGIFDLDNTSQSHITRRFLTLAEKSGTVINAAEDIPKSFVVCHDGEKRCLYLSQMSTQTLLKRTDFLNTEEIRKRKVNENG